MRFIPLTFLFLAAAAPAADPKDVQKGNELAGVITLNGKPLAEAMISFHPADDGKKPFRARTDADGKYRATGLPAGEYTVTIIKTIDDGKAKPRNVVAPKYADPKTSGIKVKVEKGQNAANFDLASK